jgi:hypothetical protein
VGLGVVLTTDFTSDFTYIVVLTGSANQSPYLHWKEQQSSRTNQSDDRVIRVSATAHEHYGEWPDDA